VSGKRSYAANAPIYAADARVRAAEALIRAELPWIIAGIVALAFGFAVGLKASPAGFTIFGMIHPKSFDVRASVGSQIPLSAGMRVASLEADFVLGSAIAAPDRPSRSSTFAKRYASFDGRVLFDPSSGQPPAGTFVPAGSSPARGTQERTRTASLVPPDSGEHATIHRAFANSAPQLAPVPAPKVSSLPPDAEGDTAIYDIKAHTVYLPDGQRLEAHSGLGSLLDDPRHVDAKDRGPTPPNVYDLALREEPFHGVRALRLIPVGDGKMYGRDGMLAHSYMLGPNGQSNGCVSFSDYEVFLNAFLRGDVHRLVVVEHLDTAPRPETASGWFAETVHALFGRS
jgi:hypothetical protein